MDGRGIMALSVLLLLLGTWAYAADCNSGGRYENMTDGTVTDCRTGLIWLKNANCTDSLSLPGLDKSQGRLPWHDAMRWVAALDAGHCELTDSSSAGDWRLPTKTEWMAMVAYARKIRGYSAPALTNADGTAKWTEGNIFDNVQSDFYWSSTTYAADTGSACYIYLLGGGTGFQAKDHFYFVWPVRAGQSASFGSLTLE